MDQAWLHQVRGITGRSRAWSCSGFIKTVLCGMRCTVRAGSFAGPDGGIRAWARAMGIEGNECGVGHMP